LGLSAERTGVVLMPQLEHRGDIAADGYPKTTDIDFRMIIGYARNADCYEDWITNPLPRQNAAQRHRDHATADRLPEP
jgi:hypothetical protein